MKQIKTILFAFGCSFLLSGTKAFAQVERLPDEASYPVLQELAGVETPAVLLSGTWQFRYSPDSKWDKIQVPGEPAMQGYAIEHDKPFTYRKSFTVPADYAGKHTILRFDGVYSHARLFVNGTFVREHHGGFTRWDTDVTPFVRPGKKNEIRLEVTDRLDDISYASGYAHHPIGGILRDVTLFALPETCLYDFYAETHLDAAYEDAVLKIGYSSPVVGGAEVAYTLADPSGRRYPLAQSRFPLKEGGNMNELPVKNPLKWDAEHPNLYTLTVTLSKDGKEIGRFDRRIGFRDVKIEKEFQYELCPYLALSSYGTFLRVLRPLRHLCGERDGCLFRRYLPAEELCAGQDAGQCRVYAPLSLAMPRDGEVVPFPSLHPVLVDRQ